MILLIRRAENIGQSKSTGGRRTQLPGDGTDTSPHPPCRGRARLRATMLPAALAALFLLGAFGAARPANAQDTMLPKGPNRELVYGKCRTCHSLQSVEDSAGITRTQWENVLSDMGMYGLDVTDKERDRILEYLATYLGPNPPASAEAGDTADEEQTLAGRDIFAQQCSSCHKTTGTGRPGEFPPLADNPDLFLTAEYPALVLLNGMHGPIRVHGETFNGLMPSFGFLADQQIAKVIEYVRGAWGNDAHRPEGLTDLSAKDIAAVRGKSLAPEDVHAYRRKHGGKQPSE